MNKSKKSFLKKNIPALMITICLIAVFWTPLNNIIVTALVKPLFMHVKNHSWLIQIVLFILTIIYYILIIKQLKREPVLSGRRIITLEIIVVYFSVFRFSGLYLFYGIGDGFPAYLDVVAILSFVIELSFIIRNSISTSGNTASESVYTSFFIDQPTEKDDLKRGGYALTLVEKIISTFPKNYVNNRNESIDGSFTVLLSERFGQGKSSFFEQIKRACKKKDIEVIEFRPWLSNESGQMILNFFNLLRENLGAHDKELRRFLQSYAILASDHISGKAAKASLNLLNSISIETHHDRISRILQEEGKLRIVLIDDVDRLQSDELLALIKLIRNTADFPYIAYVVAADKEAVKETLRSASISDTELYLKKFFNFELLFPADDNNVLGKLIDRITETLIQFGYTQQDIKEIRDNINKYPQYYTPVFSNMRDVYRFCNILSFELDVLKNIENSDDKNKLLKDIYIADFVSLCMIQYVSPSLYKIFRDYRHVLLDDSNHEKLVLSNSCKKYVESSDRIQHIHEVVREAGLRVSNNNIERESQSIVNNNGTIKSELKTHADLLANISPDEEELIKYLIGDLWNDTDDHTDSRKVCFQCSYFLYFSGRQ